MVRKSEKFADLVVTTIRLPKGIIEFIESDIEENQLHRDRTNWIQTACNEYREKRLAETKSIKGNKDAEK